MKQAESSLPCYNPFESRTAAVKLRRATTMTKHIVSMTMTILTVLTMAGCVSTKKFKMAETQVADTKTKLATAETQIAELKTALDKTNADLATTRSERDQLTSSNADLSAALTAKKGELTKMVSDLTAQKTALEKQVADLTQAQAGLKAQRDREIMQMMETHDKLVSAMQQEIMAGQVAITNIQGKLSVNVADKIFFDSGKTEIKPGGREVLQRVGEILKKLTDKQIRIDGHTDNVPIGSALAERYPTNWDLSAARAIQVVRFLQEKAGVPPEMLSATGFGPYRPVASNDVEAERAKNRRIEIVVLDKDVAVPPAPAAK
ncbi:MAG: hypothetical protein KCHDKBKB_01772 [Elusimicrobia bacterium]|nr:hypothetical protein [Elusimicrobiota bacterium]